MRSITFTNAVFGAALIAGVAVAQDAPEGPDPGCYVREYSQSHLDKHPDQVARNIYLLIQDQDLVGFPERYAYMVVDFANQGHIAANGHGAQRLDNSFVCFQLGNGRKGCALDCDNGSFVVRRQDASGMTIEVPTLLFGSEGECLGPIDLSEKPGEWTPYRLNKVDEKQCLAQVEN